MIFMTATNWSSHSTPHTSFPCLVPLSGTRFHSDNKKKRQMRASIFSYLLRQHCLVFSMMITYLALPCQLFYPINWVAMSIKSVPLEFLRNLFLPCAKLACLSVTSNPLELNSGYSSSAIFKFNRFSLIMDM